MESQTTSRVPKTRAAKQVHVAAGGPYPKKGKASPSLALPSPELSLTLSGSVRWLVMGGVAMLAIALGLYLVYSAKSINGTFGFPLDDAWIHLSFARTLAETGRFAYFSGASATSGSTSPLFTITESILWLFTQREFLIGYLIGIVSLASAGVAVYTLVDRESRQEAWLSIVASLLVVLQPKLLGISVSGMETTLTISILLWALFAYRTQRFMLLGVLLGLSIWARPDTVLFLGAIGLQALYDARVRNTSIEWKKVSTVLGVFVAAYLLFNFMLSGSLLPNTFSAKLEYYSHGNGRFSRDLIEFLTADGMWAATLFAAISLIATIGQVIRKRQSNAVALHIFIVGLIAVYGWKLPYLYQGGRYLIPVLPFIALAGIDGFLVVRRAFIRVTKSVKVANVLPLILLLIGITSQAGALGNAREEFAERSAYIGDLQVRAAQWCNAKLPKSAVIATHDIGALGFYSHRPVVDIVGLIDKDIQGHIGDSHATLEFMRKRGVTHTAFLNSWFEVPNEKPLYSTDPRAGETMQVMLFTPQTAITSPTVLSIHKFAEQNMSSDPEQAFQGLTEGINLEPRNPRTHLLMGLLMANTKRNEEAEDHFRTSLDLFPNDPVANSYLGQLLANEGKTDSAVKYLHVALTEDPHQIQALSALVAISKSVPAEATNRASYEAQLAAAKKEIEENTPRVVSRSAR